MSSNVLILGASGRFGRHCAEAFTAAGWQVHRFDRTKDDLMRAAQNAEVIVNGWHPPYPDWAAKVPELTRKVIMAAQVNNATVILPGNVYVYGVEAPESFGPNTPHMAKNALGNIRITMERSFRDARIQTIILRAGDFLDTTNSGNWFDSIIAAKAAKGKVSYPGRLDVNHAWAYLPDLARAAVELGAMRHSLQQFEDIAFPGYTLTGKTLGDAVERAVQKPIKIKTMSWLPLHIASPFWSTARYLKEMRYLWDKPHYLDGTRFNKLFPNVQPTPLDKAITESLKFQINPNKPVTRTIIKQRA